MPPLARRASRDAPHPSQPTCRQPPPSAAAAPSPACCECRQMRPAGGGGWANMRRLRLLQRQRVVGKRPTSQLAANAGSTSSPHTCTPAAVTRCSHLPSLAGWPPAVAAQCSGGSTRARSAEKAPADGPCTRCAADNVCVWVCGGGVGGGGARGGRGSPPCCATLSTPCAACRRRHTASAPRATPGCGRRGARGREAGSKAGGVQGHGGQAQGVPKNRAKPSLAPKRACCSCPSHHKRNRSNKQGPL